MPDTAEELSPFTWNLGIPRWLGFGRWGRIAWATKGATPEGTWEHVFGRLYLSDRRSWDALMENGLIPIPPPE